MLQNNMSHHRVPLSRSTIGRIRSAIIRLLLLLVTWQCNGLQYQPIEAYANGDDCALVLNGPGRSTPYDYTYNLLRGSFPPTGGSQTCITYDAVNRAYIEARKRINVAQPKGKTWRPEDLATVGELLLDITSNLVKTYGLTVEDIEKSLPLIDTSKTLISEVCPTFLSDVECRPGKYRRNDGLCTNLRNPTWGSTLSPFQRLMPPRFADGLTAPRISVTGRDLPLSRIVSRTMHPDEGYHDHAGTVMVIAWGQFMDHDYTLTGTPLDPLNRNDPEECCRRPPHLKNPYCNEIYIPEDDYFYRLFNVKCLDFVRAFPAVRPGCRLGSRVPFNLLTGVLDGNTVYGVTETFARKLRTGYGGLLRMNPVFSEYGLKDLLPLKLDIPDEGCTRPNRSMYCFEAGEIRVNEQLVLTCMHTLMAREHNRIAKSLNQINPHWDDETLFQETRRIVIAQIQHITYNEFLPILLGKDVMEKFGLLLDKNGYWDGYDESVNPAVIDAFASAAFRFGHSLLPTAVERWSKAHKFIASKRLSDLIRRPYDLYRAGVFDEYIMGLMNQVAQAMDDSITQEVTNHLFKKAGAKFGLDLVSFNMQRGREFAIPSYMEFRKFCGLPWADTFEELFGSMPNETIRRYSSIFEHPADVDLWSGGVSERPLPGSMLGPTFACVIATQFSYSRRGDRFWYELPNQPSSFTPEQLNEIRKIKLARVICDNTDLIDTIQIYPMVLPDHEINPRVACRSGVLPSMDLTKWADYPASSHGQYQLVEEHLHDARMRPTRPKTVRNNYNREEILRLFFESINGIASYLGLRK
ncbi:peroxidase homolog [Augochlora pura]